MLNILFLKNVLLKEYIYTLTIASSGNLPQRTSSIFEKKNLKRVFCRFGELRFTASETLRRGSSRGSFHFGSTNDLILIHHFSHILFQKG